MKINEFMQNRKTLIVVICVVLVAVMLIVHSVITNNILSADNGDDFASNSNINPRYNEIMRKGVDALETPPAMMITRAPPLQQRRITASSGTRAI